jgi:hypothetical protein
MHHILYIKSRCLTYTPLRFGSRRRHLQGEFSQLLTFHHVRWFQTTVGRCCSTHGTPFIKLYYGLFDDQAKLRESLTESKTQRHIETSMSYVLLTKWRRTSTMCLVSQYPTKRLSGVNTLWTGVI